MTKQEVITQLLKTHGTLTQHQTIVCYLWEQKDWVPTHELVKLRTAYGFTGSDGDKRARELIVNDCHVELQGKIERAEGRNINKDPRYTYFRYRIRPIDEWNNEARLKEFENA